VLRVSTATFSRCFSRGTRRRRRMRKRKSIGKEERRSRGG